jgi:4-amino-4-deoxy-L-arabinose transferase-like glycosyltransferase
VGYLGLGVAILLAAAAGIVLRVWAYRAATGMPDSDEAVVGLMARHALRGELTTFYWGQPYGGPQEMLLSLPLFWITGGSLLALRLAPIALSAVAAILVWRVGRRTIGAPAAAVAGAVFWLWPPFNLQHLTHAYDFYGTDVFYCSLLLLLALRIVELPSRMRVALFGLVLGLAYWQTTQIIPIALPVIGWTIWKRHGAFRPLWIALPLAALGASPWLIWNAQHDWASVMRRSSLQTHFHGLRLIVSPLLPMTLGLRAPLTQQLLLPKALTYLVYAGLLGRTRGHPACAGVCAAHDLASRLDRRRPPDGSVAPGRRPALAPDGPSELHAARPHPGEPRPPPRVR